MKQAPINALNIQRILVALEAGGHSDGAVLRALELSELFDARVEVVHAVGAPGVRWELVPTPMAVASRMDPITLVREKLVDQLGEVLVQSRRPRERAEELLNVVAGQPAAVLVDRAKEFRADVLVLGALRKRRLLDLGSTARGVLAKAPCAIWTEPQKPAPIKKILAAVDFSPESALALATAVEFARRTGGRVRALQVLDPRPFAMDDWYGVGHFASLDEARRATQEEFEKEMARVDWKGVPHDMEFVIGTPELQIQEQAESHDLVLLGTHGRSAFTSAVLGSVAYSVLVHAAKPTLVVRVPSRDFAHA